MADTDKAKACVERQRNETQLLLQRTQMIILLNSIAAVAASKDIPCFSLFVLWLVVVLTDFFWLRAGRECQRVMKELRHELDTLDQTALPHDEIVRNRAIQSNRLAPTDVFSVWLPAAILTAWILCGASWLWPWLQAIM